MSIARKIMLLVAMALAAMAFTATTASAQEDSVSVIEEAGDPCNPCEVHIEGESHIRAGATGPIISRCNDEFNATIGADGSGEITWLGASDIAPGCNTVNCESVVTGADGLVESDWPLALGEIGTGVLHANVRFCLRAGANELHCDGEIGVSSLASHNYEFSTPAGGISCLGGLRIVEGMWRTEGTEEIVISHS